MYIIRKHQKKFLLAAILIVFVGCMLMPWKNFIQEPALRLTVDMKIGHEDVIQLFYIAADKNEFTEADSIKKNIKRSNGFQSVSFKLPAEKIKRIRIDTGNNTGPIEIKEVRLANFSTSYAWDAEALINSFKPSGFVQSLQIKNKALSFISSGNDPFLESGEINDVYDNVKKDNVLYVYSVLGILIILGCAFFAVKVLYKRVFAFLGEIYSSRRLIFELAKKDMQTRYLGSYLGIVWAFVQPAITILIFWFVFQVGFKSAPVENFPFILWLICGMIPWFFFSESLQSATNSVVDNSYLVKKVVFKVNILPIIRIVSSLFIHLFFVVLIFIMFTLYGYKPSIYNLQVIYYLAATVILILGLSWITSALVIFLKDLGQIIGIIIQFGFWMTPIFWSFKILPEQYQTLFKLNPMYYIIEGYRDSFINHVWFWQHYNQTVNFWMIACSAFFVGVLLFKRLQPHFADVL